MVVAHFVVIGPIDSVGNIIAKLLSGLSVHFAAQLVELDLARQLTVLAEFDLIGPH